MNNGLLTSAPADDLAGELLYLALVKYNMRMDEGVDSINAIERTVSTHETRIGMTRAGQSVQYLDDLPFAVLPDKLLIDFRRSFRYTISVDTGNFSNNTWLLQGHNLSALEHQIWEDLVRLDAVSTMKGFQWASVKGIPIVECTTTGCIDGTQLSEDLQTKLKGLISAGLMLLSRHPIESLTEYTNTLIGKDISI